jgi:putative long chain acyl-CoA synthase
MSQQRSSIRWQNRLRRLGMAAQNALEVARLGRLSSPYSAAFEVVHTSPTYRLRHYAAPAGYRPSRPRPAVLLIPPLLVTSEVYDISPELSAVTFLGTQEIDVWLVDFGAPEHTSGGMDRTLDDHVRAVADAVDRVRQATGRDAHLVGYSQGGMFAYQAAALRRSRNVASIVTFGSPVDIHRNVPLIRRELAERLISATRNAIARPLASTKGVPGALGSTAFKVLSVRKEAGQMIDFLRKLHDRQALERRESRRLFIRGDGFVAWPGPALRDFIDEFIVQNRMLSGGFVIDGQVVTLADIDCPVLFFLGSRDAVVRPDAARGIGRAAPRAQTYEVSVPAGHFGLVVGSVSMTRTWPTVARWLHWRQGIGPRPAALPADDAADGQGDELDLFDRAIDDMQLDIELAVDLLVKASGALWQRMETAAEETVQSLGSLRHQVGRLSRLRAIHGDQRLSSARTLAEQARSIADRTFFLWQGRAFTYRQADRRVDNVVRGLIGLGARPGARVGLLMGSRPSHLTAVVALNRLGAIAVLLPADGDDSVVAEALALAEVDAVITDPDNAHRAAAAYAGPVWSLGAARDERQLPARVDDMEAIDPTQVAVPAWYRANPGRASDVCALFFTASRTDEPRLVRITNRRWAFAAWGAAAITTLAERDTVYCCLPLHHLSGGLVAAGAALVSGARLAFAPAFAPATLWRDSRRYGVTVVFYAGEMCRALVDSPLDPLESHHPVRMFAGSGMAADVWRRLRSRFGPVGVLECYATSEGNAVLANASGEKLGALGRPLPGSADLEVAAYDFQAGDLRRDHRGRGQACAVGEAGVLLARIDALHPVNRDHPASLGAGDGDRVARDVFAEGDLWFVTGDLVRRDADGDFWLVDRLSDVITTATGPVASRDVEQVLYRLSGIELAAVYGRTPAVGPSYVEASLVVRGGPEQLDLAELTAAVRAGLHPDARPRTIYCVDAVPMTSGFRPLKRRAQARAEAGTGVLARFEYDGAHATYRPMPAQSSLAP